MLDESSDPRFLIKTVLLYLPELRDPNSDIYLFSLSQLSQTLIVFYISIIHKPIAVRGGDFTGLTLALTSKSK